MRKPSAPKLPPPPKAPIDGPHRRASIAFVAATVLQAIFILVGVGLLALGAAVGTQALLFLAVAGIAGWALLGGLVLVRRGRLKPSAAWAVFAVPVIDAVLVAALAGGLARGSCSDTELRQLGELPAGPGVTQTYVYNQTEGACIGSFDVAGSGAAVVERYRAHLSAQGWTVTEGSVRQESMEDGSSMTTGAFSAVRGSSNFSLAYEEYQGSAHMVARMSA